jgi:hypothetical protein
VLLQKLIEQDGKDKDGADQYHGRFTAQSRELETVFQQLYRHHADGRA